MIKKIDHIVITTSDIEKCFEFYQKLGFKALNNGRYELVQGDFKINVHELGHELLPHAGNVQVGSVDICFETELELDVVHQVLIDQGIEFIDEFVSRNGRYGPMKSLYLRDPDGNLLEISKYIKNDD